LRPPVIGGWVRFIGIATDLPDDLAINHGYYVHGQSHKQRPRKGRWIPADEATPRLTEEEAKEFARKLVGLAAEKAM
jgi:hypothetical protein